MAHSALVFNVYWPERSIFSAPNSKLGSTNVTYVTSNGGSAYDKIYLMPIVVFRIITSYFSKYGNWDVGSRLIDHDD